MATKLQEVVFLTNDGLWETELVELPEEACESQDAYIHWAYSDDGAWFRDTWHKDVVATYWWAEVDSDDP